MEVFARLDSVTKTYGSVVALDSVSVVVPAGVTAVLGPNGAGKSTMIEILAGLRRPGSGRVEVLGGNPADIGVKARLGLTPQRTALPWRLTVAETLALIAAHYPDPVPRAELVEQLGLGPFLTKRCGTLSGGQRRRVALATALVGRPELLFLDEPTTGLDADSRDGLWSAIATVAAAGSAVLLTTHDMAEAEHLAEQVVVVTGGQVARTGSVTEVVAEVGLHLVDVEVTGVLPPIAVSGPADRVETVGNRTHIYTADPDATVRALVRADVSFTGIRVERVGLEEAIRTISKTVDPGTVARTEIRVAEKVA
ncbi:ABC transporter ATP-binding protein [Micromonospora sp. NBC_01813]|uniref:ABC transporter ATP-binding protein n=1 Tax=Micromonospora sp. NBC_01813 TaxID=2975988 RepID=UPI002DDC80DD|nr:ABC transporter ATP-binding protein [Micromonospora sp. NBC_01813]WSA11856.1 ABC transporter ATP-binding protein [Micromonospora sp. NBC_01813]